MKNITIALTLGILLLSSALLVSIPRNIIAQQEEAEVDYTMTKEEIQTKITELYLIKIIVKNYKCFIIY
jgi:hypothetical protein